MEVDMMMVASFLARVSNSIALSHNILQIHANFTITINFSYTLAVCALLLLFSSCEYFISIRLVSSFYLILLSILLFFFSPKKNWKIYVCHKLCRKSIKKYIFHVKTKFFPWWMRKINPNECNESVCVECSCRYRDT